MKKYFLHFSLAFVITMIAFLILSSFIPGLSSAVILFPSLFAPAAYTMSRFIKNESRIPTKIERHRLTQLSVLAVLIINILQILLLLIFTDGRDLIGYMMSQTSILIAILVFAFVVGISYLILFYSYGWSARTFGKSLTQNKD